MDRAFRDARGIERVRTRQKGNYWIGVVLDERGAIAETAEWNNANYIPIQLQ